jgi:hypothetical protein
MKRRDRQLKVLARCEAAIAAQKRNDELAAELQRTINATVEKMSAENTKPQADVDMKFARIADEIKTNKRWRKLLAGDWREEQRALEQIAKRYGGENTHTGGNIYVVLVPLSPHDVMAVSAEAMCRYHDEKLTDAYEIFWEPDNYISESAVSLCD